MPGFELAPNREEVVATFLHQNGFRGVREADSAGWWPLHYAALSGNPKLINRGSTKDEPFLGFPDNAHGVRALHSGWPATCQKRAGVSALETAASMQAALCIKIQVLFEESSLAALSTRHPSVPMTIHSFMHCASTCAVPEGW